MITLLHVDGYEMIREAIQALNEESDDLQVQVTTSNGIEAVAQARSGWLNAMWSVFRP